MDKISVSLAPSPGFCVKSVALQAAVCKVTPPQQPHPAQSASPHERLDVPPASTSSISIPKGVKIFVNIAYDPSVPPPPDGSEDVIQKAMQGEDVIQKAMQGEDVLDADNAQGWFVPIVVPEPREDIDKAGKPSIVFDSIYHSSLKSRALKDPAFKTFLIELAFQRIEASYAVPLARQIGTPNIKAKGGLSPRTVQIPASLFPEGHPAPASSAKSQGKKLVEELASPAARPKGILKKPRGSTDPPALTDSPGAAQASPSVGKRPELSWSKNALTEGLQINLAVPELTHAYVSSATLDVEPRRLILSIPPLYALDLNLDLPDAQIRYGLQLSRSSVDQVLMLRRQRDLDVDSARAEWRVAEGRLVVHV